MALQEEPKHVAVKNDLIIFNCNYLIKICVRLCHYIRDNFKSLRDFRPLRYSSRYGHAEGEHVNRGRDTPSFCPTLQVLDMYTLGDAADVNPVIKFGNPGGTYE